MDENCFFPKEREKLLKIARARCEAWQMIEIEEDFATKQLIVHISTPGFSEKRSQALDLEFIQKEEEKIASYIDFMNSPLWALRLKPIR